MEVLVVGGGLVGAAVARSLSVRGDRVTLLDAGSRGSGTSGTSFAWVNANNKHPLPYFALNRAGMEAHYDLAGEGAGWFRPTGNLEWACDDDHERRLTEKVALLRDRDYDARLISVDEARELEPDVSVPSEAGTLAYFAQEAHCFAMPLLARLLGEAAEHGASLRFGQRVTGIETRAGRARVTVTGGDDSDALTADAVVCCAGRWTSHVLGASGIDLPMLGPGHREELTLGYLATTTPVPVRLSRVLTTPGLNVRPAGGGALLLQSLDLDPATSPATVPPPDGAEGSEMLRRLGELTPSGIRPEVRDLVLGRRVMPADGLTVCGFHPGERIYTVATHSGVTLAPLLGGVVAAELHGAVDPRLEPFRPTRFSDGSPLSEPARALLAGDQ